MMSRIFIIIQLRTVSWPLAAAPCLNRVQTSNKAHDKFVPRRDCACADHSRPSLSTALLSGWSSHLVNRVSPHNPLVPSTLARARRAYPSQAQLGYTGAGRSAPHLVLIMFQLAFPLSQARTPWTRQARLRSPKACVRGHDRSLPHLFLIGFRPATRLMISSCRVVTALALITRAPPYLPPCWAAGLHTLLFHLLHQQQ